MKNTAAVAAPWGIIFWLGAIYFLVTGFLMETTVASEFAPAGFDGVVNLQALHQQAMTFNLGIGAALIGTLLLCTAAIVSRRD
jgi:ABC-type phosphate transport system permease subunit